MRILMTTDPLGGVWQYSLVLAHTLARQLDCRVALICFGQAATDPALAIPSERIELIELPYKLEWMPHSSDDVELALAEVARLADSWGADVIHSNQYCFGKLGGSRPTVVVAHSDVLSWHLCHRGSEMKLDLQMEEYRNLLRAGLSGAGTVVCPSHFVANYMKTIYSADARVIYNGLPPTLYDASMPKEHQAAVAGRLWDESKLAAVAVQAVEGLPIRLELAGPTLGPDGEASFLPSAANACYLGALSWQDTRRLFARSRFYLATSSYEPFGLAALEAALSGCVLLAADTPSYREIWGDAALFYEPRNPAALRNALMQLLGNDAGVEKLPQAARGRALERYTSDRMAREYYRLYEHLLTGEG
ncbi:MAG TPA: glycosyltransferase family 4 protein [Chloroflexota bacterium]|nr:glycosyltransferase family 4 protein [Chloroflexota bacterium]